MDSIIELILSQAGMAGALLIPVVWGLVHLAKQVKILQDAAVTREKEHAAALAKQGAEHQVVVRELTSEYTQKLEGLYSARTNDSQVTTTTFLDMQKQSNESQAANTSALQEVAHTLSEVRSDLRRRTPNNRTPRPE